MPKRGVYIGPLKKQMDNFVEKSIEDPKLKKKMLQMLGRKLVKMVIYEGRKDLARAGKSPRGQPVKNGGGLGEEFFNSVKYRIVGQSTIEVYSNWKWLEMLLQGLPKHKMTTLVASRNPKLWKTTKNGKVRKTLPLSDGKGGVVFRVAPLELEDAWIHPGIAKHTFWERGVRKWKREAPKEISKFIARNMR